MAALSSPGGPDDRGGENESKERQTALRMWEVVPLKKATLVLINRDRLCGSKSCTAFAMRWAVLKGGTLNAAKGITKDVNPVGEGFCNRQAILPRKPLGRKSGNQDDTTLQWISEDFRPSMRSVDFIAIFWVVLIRGLAPLFRDVSAGLVSCVFGIPPWRLWLGSSPGSFCCSVRRRTIAAMSYGPRPPVRLWMSGTLRAHLRGDWIGFYW